MSRVGRRYMSVLSCHLLKLKARNYSVMSGLLVEDQKYSWLKDLGLGTDNVGAFYGEWNATGEVRGRGSSSLYENTEPVNSET